MSRSLSIPNRARLMLAGTLAVTALVPAAAQADPIGVGQFPSAAGCTSDELVASKDVIYNTVTGNRIGAVRLMYSSRCQTWWSRLVNDDGRRSSNVVTASTAVTTVPFQGFSDRQDAQGFVGPQDTKMVPAFVLSQIPGGLAPTIGQARGVLFRGTGEVAGQGLTRLCLPPTSSNPCPSPN